MNKYRLSMFKNFKDTDYVYVYCSSNGEFYVSDHEKDLDECYDAKTDTFDFIEDFGYVSDLKEIIE